MEKLNNINSELLVKALANPLEVLNTNASDIGSLVNDFPQSGLLRALLAANGHDENVKHAAAYINPAILYKLVNAPESLPEVATSQVIFIDEAADVEATRATTNDITFQTQHESLQQEHEFVKEEEIVEEVEAEEQQSAPAYTLDKTEFFHQDIEDEVYEEIVSIEDINLEQIASSHINNNSSAANPTSTDAVKEVPEPTAQIPANDHFVIDTAFVQEQPSEKLSHAVATVSRDGDAENQNLSRYNDEKMPYSFMWWLDKTRKEHAQTYQPYVYNAPVAVNESVSKNGVDELQQQYVENIFNLNAIEELERSTAKKGLNFNQERKEDRIIKRFIQAEPQIKHPADVKLNTENKAKKSSEDHEELVTETLARIYTEQMLYQKAIMAYKKLMLKFPEKSLYFAGQIEQLEKKIN